MKQKRSLAVLFTIVICLLISLLNAAQIVYISERTKKSIASEYEQICNNVCATYAADIGSEINEFINEMTAYTESDIAKSDSPEEIGKWLENHKTFHSDDFVYVGYCGKDGILRTELSTVIDINDRPYFKAIMKDNELENVDTPLISRTTGKASIHVSKAVRRNGETVGFFTGVVDVGTIQKLIEQKTLGETGYAWLMADDGQVMSHKVKAYEMKVNFLTDLSDVHADMQHVAEYLSQEKSGSGWVNSMTAEAGKEKRNPEYVAYIPVANTPWSLGFSMSKSQIYATAYALVKMMIILGVSIDIIIGILSGIIIRAVLKPLTVVKKTITSIASGNADLTQRIEIKSKDEIGTVVDGFNKFTGKMQDIISILKKSKDSLVVAGDTLNTQTEETAASIEQILLNIQSVQSEVSTQAGSVEQTAGADRKS